VDPGVVQIGVAIVGAAQAVLLAVIALRQSTMGRNLNGHLSRLELVRATDDELTARRRVAAADEFGTDEHPHPRPSEKG
jgi:hypothetical protein